jgi:hypothetical protein
MSENGTEEFDELEDEPVDPEEIDDLENEPFDPAEEAKWAWEAAHYGEFDDDNDDIDYETTCQGFINKNGELIIVCTELRLQEEWAYDEKLSEHFASEFYQHESIWTYEISNEETQALATLLHSDLDSLLLTLATNYGADDLDKIGEQPHSADNQYEPIFGELVVDLNPFNETLHALLRAHSEWEIVEGWEFDPVKQWHLDLPDITTSKQSEKRETG